MAGTNGGFNAAAFRTGIRFAMTMGAPATAADSLRFFWNPIMTTTAVTDGDRVPFDPAAAITVTQQKAPVTKPCAVEHLDVSGEPTPFGVIVPAKIRVTLLDEDYKAVKDADYVVYGGDKYVRYEQPPPLGLFDATIFQIVYVAENEI